ncbi:release factor glutamine methyltransferase [Thalassobaculum fulvum]|uniref:Release factor glutamine methyltransferase n=1 Tax=Thalassobaculum fulvum TaxID=1633335 RepID=A0A918XTU5_9PROT|nr:peptide chain release factor N(5)-glutamine methyltransferase [Thalassobaculum fulvum]GHD55663.1 release factor glutamine methyltransferase [Thalassobaculum fulvum]
MTPSPTPAVADILRDAARRLAAAGIDTARLDARLLLGEALGREVWPHESGPVGSDGRARFEALLARRLAREPVSRILGRRAFWTLDLGVGPDTLDPRPDSETLIEAAVEAFAGRPGPRRILDLGTGTGCLLLAALSEFADAAGIGVDRLPGAVETARENARRTGLADRARFLAADWNALDADRLDWGPAPPGRADLVLSNPPYIEDETVERLEPEVALFDPRGALAAGPDGLDAYRELFRILPHLIDPQGIVVLELGEHQRQIVSDLAAGANFTVRNVRRDLGGVERALVLKWNDTVDDCLNTNDFCLE